MKYLKMFGLATVAACALMALVGAGTASASAVLCENLSQSSGCSSDVAKGSALEFSLESGTSLLLKGPFGETLETCSSSTIDETTTTTGSGTEAVKGNIGTWTFGPFGDEPLCTATVTSTGTLEVNNIAGTKNGTVKSSGATVILHNTPLFGDCRYSTNGSSLGTLTGSSNTGGAATIDINATLSSEDGCPTGSWNGKYVATGATSSYNVLENSAGAVLCEALAQSSGCTSDVAKGSELEFSLESGTSTLLKGPFGETLSTCTSSTVKGTTTTTGSGTESVKGTISSLNFGPAADEPVCTVAVVTTGTLEVTNLSGTKNGTVSSSGTTVLLHNVPLFGECRYSTNGTSLGTLTGSSTTGGAATFDISASITSEETKTCPTGTWSGKYVATGGTSSYNVTPS